MLFFSNDEEVILAKGIREMKESQRKLSTPIKNEMFCESLSFVICHLLICEKVEWV
jgi:hypothetical protein